MKGDIDIFLDYLSREKRCSENTLCAYKNDLNQLAGFVQAKTAETGAQPCWAGLDPGLVIDYVHDLKVKKYAPATVARKIATAKSFLSCMVAMGKLQANPTEQLASPRVDKPLPTSLSVSEVRALLAEPAKLETPEAKRDCAMLQLLYATGMRVSQLVSLDLADVDTVACNVRCSSRAAGPREIPVDGPVVRQVTDYVNGARAELDRDGQQALFLNQRGERLTRQGFWLILKGYARKAAISKAVTPHTLRHSFATHMLRGGAPLRNVQELLGHANMSTTQVYTKLTDDMVRQVYEKAHPRAK